MTSLIAGLLTAALFGAAVALVLGEGGGLLADPQTVIIQRAGADPGKDSSGARGTVDSGGESNGPGAGGSEGGARLASADSSPHRTRPSVARRPSRQPRFALVRLEPGHRIEVSRRPEGPAALEIASRTEFGSPVVLGVVRRRGDWLGFPTPELPNGVLGWTRYDKTRMQLDWTKYWLRVDLNSRTLTVRYGRGALARWRVTVGAGGSETPPGRFTVTDAVAYDSSPYYGCCALALSGHQPKLPSSWPGGSRLAIHGTIGPLGQALSLGCIRARNSAMRELFRRVPLGAPVFVS